MEEVVGWNRKGRVPMSKQGLFGDVFAISYCIEEQGRKTLHCHMQIWIEGYKEVQKDLFFGPVRKKLEAERVMEKFYDHVASTEMFPKELQVLQKVFDHPGCGKPRWKNRELPLVVCDQSLRELRHRQGFNERNGHFASCPHCTKTWSVEELVMDLLKHEGYLSDAYQYEAVCMPVSDPNSSETAPPPLK